MTIVGSIIDWVLWIFLLILFARMILSWVPVLVRDWEPRGPVLVAAEIVYSITDPPIMFFRRFIPPLRLGSVALDLSFMIVIIICYLLLILNRSLLLS